MHEELRSQNQAEIVQTFRLNIAVDFIWGKCIVGILCLLDYYHNTRYLPGKLRDN